MICRLTDFPVRGAIWYQGEGNVGDGMLYYYKMKALIEGWRSAWHQGDFPFLYVQLRALRLRHVQGLEGPVAAARALGSANAGPLDSQHRHGRDQRYQRRAKHTSSQQAGGRPPARAMSALAGTYGRTGIACFGPMYRAIDVEQGRIRVRFDHADDGLVSSDSKPLTWFTVAGDDRVFHAADAVIDGATVVVSSRLRSARPVAVRFAWHKLRSPI